MEEGCHWKDRPGEIYRDLNKIQLEHCGIEPTVELVDKIQEAYKDAKNQALYDDVLPTLKELKRWGYLLGTLTGGLSVDMEHRLKLFGIRDYFEHIVATATLPFGKPEPETFHYILKLTGLTPEEMAYVGDNYEQDIVAATKVGILAILVVRNKKYSALDCNRVTDLRNIFDFLNGGNN
ncbi:MAG: HAD family hydrolase [Candidatus Cloacimonetes bacterium]|nr:HAD family hydrolase [Candidatus Cloacimonadota bacterium]